MLPRLLPTLLLMLAAFSAGCATSGAPVAATDWAARDRALCENYGGVWMAGAGACARNGI